MNFVGFITILVILFLVFVGFVIYFFFKSLEFLVKAINLYEKMINRQDMIIKLLSEKKSNGNNSNQEFIEDNAPSSKKHSMNGNFIENKNRNRGKKSSDSEKRIDEKDLERKMDEKIDYMIEHGITVDGKIYHDVQQAKNDFNELKSKIKIINETVSDEDKIRQEMIAKNIDYDELISSFQSEIDSYKIKTNNLIKAFEPLKL